VSEPHTQQLLKTATEKEEAPYNAADPEQVGQRKAKARTRDMLVSEGLRRTMSTMEGRAFMYELLDFCGTGRNPFSTHSNTMSFNAGMQNVGQKILTDIFAAKLEDEWLLMSKEAK